MHGNDGTKMEHIVYRGINGDNNPAIRSFAISWRLTNKCKYTSLFFVHILSCIFNYIYTAMFLVSFFWVVMFLRNSSNCLFTRYMVYWNSFSVVVWAHYCRMQQSAASLVVSNGPKTLPLTSMTHWRCRILKYYWL